MEARERLSQSTRSRLRKATLAEMNLARARLVDWLLYHTDWISKHPDKARTNEAVQGALIRGSLIQEAIAEYRKQGALSSLWRPPDRVREWMVSALSDTRKDWKDFLAKGTAVDNTAGNGPVVPP
jgi:hypothetical protein